MDIPLQFSSINRHTELRTQANLFDSLLAQSNTHILVRYEQKFLLRSSESQESLAFFNASEVTAALNRVYIGETSKGRQIIAVDLSRNAADELVGADPSLRWEGLRLAALASAPEEAELMVQAQAILQWHQDHQHCPRCGTVTFPTHAGWVRECPLDHSEHFPRINPCVIMTILNENDELLLARNAARTIPTYSLIAGYVEPGESLEDAVARETAEEIGLKVTDISYLASQPWPFPASLMTAFRAAASGTPKIDPNELMDAQWFSRERFTREVAEQKIIPPRALSISSALIEAWLAGELSYPTHAEAANSESQTVNIAQRAQGVTTND